MVVEKAERNSKTNAQIRRWVVCGAAIIILAAAGWWLMKPNSTQSSAASNAILATAPHAPPRPLNADGAPRSD